MMIDPDSDIPLDAPAQQVAQEMHLPPLPPLHPEASISYEHIRYVPGYPEEYVKRYAVAYAMKAIVEWNRYWRNR